MFFKQYNYKPRSNSQSSQTSSSGAPPAKEETKSTDANAPAMSAAVAGRRRSSVDQKFAGLQGQKRTTQDDRKASWTEQKAGTGILGGMWQNFTKGSN